MRTPLFVSGAAAIRQRLAAASLLLAAVANASPQSAEPPAVPLAAGVQAVWNEERAYHETTATRERISINGLWRWQPAGSRTLVPTNAWGYYKVPACWPGIQDYMQSDYQTLYRHPSWATASLRDVSEAWYERTITIPGNWSGRRITLDLEYLNSFAAVYIDGKPVGELRFPAGSLDLSAAVRPGATHLLTLQVVAMPLRAVMESYTDTNAARQKKGTVARRGLCGDAWLSSEPPGPRLADVRINTSVRQGTITFKAGLRNVANLEKCRLQARITDAGKPVAEFSSPLLGVRNLTNDTASFAASWKPPRLWDIHTPTNQYAAEISLHDATGRLLDVSTPVRFGFREFWIAGRDFYLNGTRLYLSVVPLDNAQVGAALATYDGAKESFLRLKSFGINFVYGHNYGCEPGSHLSFAEILRAADDTGMLVALSQPHFSAYDWKAPDAGRVNGYAGHAAFYVGVAGSHPSVVAYSMSHNATGYNEDMNPLKIDGRSEPRDQWSSRNAGLALRCEAIVKGLDPERVVYHHSSGNLSAMYTVNFYPNFVPIQELDDWFEHWSTTGVKPLLLVEYGAPFGWDWTMYRGWHKGRREFGSAAVPWEYCLAEWNAQFLGDAAYNISEREKSNLRWEAEQFRKGRGWYRWDYPFPVGDERLDEVHPVQAAYTTSNWRAFRTWGLSGNSPWEHARFWKLRAGFQPRRRDLPVDWENLQRPGYSPDFIDRTFARFDLAYERSDWVPSATAQSLVRNNGPLLGWIAGSEIHFTSKEHIFYPGETVRKQWIVINNSRETVKGEAAWSSDSDGRSNGRQHLEIPAGDQVRVPLSVQLPLEIKPGQYRITASFNANNGHVEKDTFEFQVVARPTAPPAIAKVALFDPRGESTNWLRRLGMEWTAVDGGSDLSGFEVLLIGRKALTVDGPAPSLHRVRDGLKVVVFEQTADLLEQRLGFRVQEYGLRQVWPRVPDSPLLAGLEAEMLRDWRGESTLLPRELDYKLSQRYSGAPAVTWCGLEVTRLWRCGNWGNVASVLIEKPHRGNFLPVLDGGYALQYSPLLEFREGKGVVLFCQMDVTGRTEPAAEILAGNIIKYIHSWRPGPQRSVAYAGDPAGREWLTACGMEAASLKGRSPAEGQVVVLGPGAGRELGDPGAVTAWLRSGGRVLALGLDQAEVNQVLGQPITLELAEHIAAPFSPFSSGSVFAGVAPADLHNRDPRKLPLVRGGAAVKGGGVLAETNNLFFCQMPPFGIGKPMQDPDTEQFNRRRTFVRSSFALSRILGNLGASGATPLLERFGRPVRSSLLSSKEERWLEGLYLTRPTEWDDPYRFFRW